MPDSPENSFFPNTSKSDDAGTVRYGVMFEHTRVLDVRDLESDGRLTPGTLSGQDGRQLILASASPRRKELLTRIGIRFTVEVPDIDEEAAARTEDSAPAGFTPLNQAALSVRRIAEAKALAVFDKLPDTDNLRDHCVVPKSEAIVLAADTIVYDTGRILGKPADAGEAMQMLKSLAGHRHQVMTAAAIVHCNRLTSFVSLTQVEFYPWDSRMEAIARQTIEDGTAMDKAGSYGIQEAGGLMVRSISGDFYTVVGLPLAEVVRRLTEKTRQI